MSTGSLRRQRFQLARSSSVCNLTDTRACARACLAHRAPACARVAGGPPRAPRRSRGGRAEQSWREDERPEPELAASIEASSVAPSRVRRAEERRGRLAEARGQEGGVRAARRGVGAPARRTRSPWSGRRARCGTRSASRRRGGFRARVSARGCHRAEERPRRGARADVVDSRRGGGGVRATRVRARVWCGRARRERRDAEITRRAETVEKANARRADVRGRRRRRRRGERRAPNACDARLAIPRDARSRPKRRSRASRGTSPRTPRRFRSRGGRKKTRAGARPSRRGWRRRRRRRRLFRRRFFRASRLREAFERPINRSGRHGHTRFGAENSTVPRRSSDGRVSVSGAGRRRR